eukprot:4298283-Prymnesium_polylepis.1
MPRGARRAYGRPDPMLPIDDCTHLGCVCQCVPCCEVVARAALIRLWVWVQDGPRPGCCARLACWGAPD